MGAPALPGFLHVFLSTCTSGRLHEGCAKLDPPYVCIVWLNHLRQSCDITKDVVTQDLAGIPGLLRFLRLALRCQEGGLGLLGTPCNSFGWMSSSQHQRTFDRPWGNRCHPWVILGNVLASRSTLVVITLLIRSVFWMVENPANSKLPVFPPLIHVMAIPELHPLRVQWPESHP